jgi:hypothetical protein
MRNVGRQSTRSFPAPDPPQEQRVANDVSSPHPPRLLQQAPRPLEAELAHPPRCPWQLAGVKIKQASDPDSRPNAQVITVFGNPPFLVGCTEGNQQVVGPGGVDHFDDCPLVLTSTVEVAVVVACDANLRPALCHPFDQRIADPRSAAEQEERLTTAFEGVAQPREEIGAVDVGGQRGPEQLARVMDADPIGQNNGAFRKDLAIARRRTTPY